jgi:catechol 2,3-dioxygenase-like lactoylglutathione lyase family enzyme/ketosteroid isomerase-like protein
MTIAGQRSSRVAELITNIGATNQMKENVVSLMSGKQSEKPGLGHFLQGVQHFGITVDDMPKALEFYTEVLGGEIAIGGEGFFGEVLHNTLFQKEDIDAIELGIDPKTIGVPNLRDGSEESLDVKFISFGNTVVELIHFRDAALSMNAPNIFGKIPSGVGHVNAPHLSFHVKDDVDLNLFAKTLEEECQKREINVVCNRVVDVNSEAERKKAEFKYNANKFWNDPEYFVEGYSDSEFGDFHGWSLFYCKGPNGEQLEFNQVTRTAKKRFKKAQEEYNKANGTNFTWASDTTIQSATKNQGGEMSEKFSGEKIDLAKQMFKAGESMNVENFVKFYTDDALYQFSNFPVAYGPQGIRDASGGFLEKVEQVYHHILNMWEEGDTVIAEMEVTYIRHDGNVFTLPCCDTIVFKGDKVQELRIYMDISPVFA